MEPIGLASGDIKALCIFGGYLTICTLLTALITGDLYKQFRICQERQPSNYDFRRCHTRAVGIFGACGIVCLSITWYYMANFFTLSYQVWAVQNEVNIPTSPQQLGDLASWLRSIRLGPWLKDVQLFCDAWEVAMETPGRLFWSQPIFFITTAWSFYLGYQARLHQIRYACAYMVLGQVVAISFAQSLFFIAVVLYSPTGSGAPIATHNTALDDKEGSRNGLGLPWHGSVLVLAFLPVIFIPATIHTPNFLTVLAIPHLTLMLPPLLDPLTRNERSGGDSMLVHKRQLKQLNTTLAICASLWQFRVASLAWNDTSANKNLHRHSEVYLHPMLDSTDSGSRDSGLQGLMRSLYDHPAVSSVGWDTLLCTINYGMWQIVSRR